MGNYLHHHFFRKVLGTCFLTLALGVAHAQQTIIYNNGDNDSSPIIITSGTNPTTLTISSGSATQSGTISESGTVAAVVKAGGGSLTFAGTNNYSGGTTISDGTLAIGSGGSVANSAGINLTSSSATFDISNGGIQSVQDLSGVSGSTVNLGYNTLIVGSSDSTTFAGTIHGGGGLVKQGSGTVTLSGTNTYSGPTGVQGGTLIVSGSTAATSVVSVGFNAASTLKVMGSVGGPRRCL